MKDKSYKITENVKKQQQRNKDSTDKDGEKDSDERKNEKHKHKHINKNDNNTYVLSKCISICKIQKLYLNISIANISTKLNYPN